MNEGFIDIHSHSLWGIDDGSQSFGETLDLCECAEENETSVLFVTPHLIYWDQAEDLLDERDEKVEYLCEELEDSNSSLIIKKGFEILCDDEIFDIKYFKPYTLNESRYILIEFDFYKTTEDDVKSWCNYLQSFGLVPIIAHPERYGFVIDDIGCLDRLSDSGVLFQINAGSPAGMFGDNEMEVSCKMLAAGYADFVGSDAHRINIRNTDMLSLFDDYPYAFAQEDIDKISKTNPLCILDDKKFIPKRKKYMQEL